MFVICVSWQVAAEDNSCPANGEDCRAGSHLFYGGVVRGQLESTHSLENPQAISRVSEFIHQIDTEYCAQWQSDWLESDEPFVEELKEQSDIGTLAHTIYLNSVICHPESAEMPRSVSLQDMTHYKNYLLNVRLPLAVAGGRKPEMMKLQWLGGASAQACTNILPTPLLNKLHHIYDPISLFPLLIELGHELRTLGQVLLPELDLASPSRPLTSQPIFFTDARKRFESLSIHWQTAYLTGQGPAWYESLYIPVSTLVPADVNVIQQPGGDARIERVEPIYRKPAVDSRWKEAFELLDFVIHQNLQDVVSDRTPYFLGFIPPERAIKYASTTGFYDLTHLAGHFSHGTFPHMFQLAHLKRFGMTDKHLGRMSSRCWDAVLDSTPVISWSFAAGIFIESGNQDLKEERIIVHDIPTLDAPEVLQRLLTYKVLSRLILNVEEHGSEQEKAYFKQHWLNTEKDLIKVAADVEALENTVLAEQLSHWDLILHYSTLLQLHGRIHGSELFFEQSKVSSGAQRDLIESYRQRGYRIEEIEQSYIFFPPDYDESWYEAWNSMEIPTDTAK
ncbi:hypothetical protein [Sansalvadorimonas verongulae]|uniref:hypothetical protein n=1 Tax=Sansalvadorimonas verongulae TaxID=2172824 RepID=UPI0012BC09EF|nr:hypothetical protein [Sansalvadorimonas verongulae]MTI14602.1 hypothetical protein [Sansalvadorimonas verongulae]